MSSRHVREVEKLVIERDTFMLIIGLVIAMVIVALTINVPNATYPAFDKRCYEVCKKLTDEVGVVKSKHFTSTTKYIIEINKCMDSCAEAKNENSDQSIAP